MKYSEEEIKKELQDFRLPWISRIWKKYGVKALRFSIIPTFITLLVFGLIYNESTMIYDWMWVVMKAIVFVFIFGFGLLGLSGHIAELITINRLRRKLGLTHEQFKVLVDIYQITGR